jgi:hypothetical protein
MDGGDIHGVQMSTATSRIFSLNSPVGLASFRRARNSVSNVGHRSPKRCAPSSRVRTPKRRPRRRCGLREHVGIRIDSGGLPEQRPALLAVYDTEGIGDLRAAVRGRPR